MSSSELLPLPWLVEASIYNVKIGNDTVITTVTDREAIVNSSISELNSELKSTPNPFVGIDVINNGDLLLFHVKKRCLIIQFKRMVVLDYQTEVPQSIKEFLKDHTITFIGPRNISQNSTPSYISGSSSEKIELNRIVDVRYLAGKLLKKPKLLSSTLEELMGEVNVDIKKPVISEGSIRPNWQSSSVLSEEEVKLAMYGVHSCYKIASKLTDAISASVRGQ
ncbi:uncharacterized protein LOC132606812 isoform X1 [Lycium barbarum]|uniref:uncharacterized protein LOC132606811 isoform X1 n=1 Tax=Lycium barbarum TaxID=112863 RepID=UPI00293E7AB4|nr:uncharacterized protein LOC132606811 isoform X1 [Lycium barbarum]XP_060176428.1 uncharacterized protein LOC132606812 isoform X1 [Lycium barbarum]